MTKKLPINPWLTMWLRPRETIKAIINYNPRYLVLFLSVLFGVSRVVDKAGPLLASFLMLNPFLTILVVLVGGAVGGVIIVYLSAFLFGLTGKFIGGRGSYEHLRAAIVWSYVPNFWILPFDILFAVLLPTLLVLSRIWTVPYILLLIADIVLGVWSFVLLLQTVGEVHKFSAWKALATFILSMIALFAIVLVIAFVIGLPIKLLV